MARPLYQAIVQREPNGYYAMWAQRRLHGGLEAPLLDFFGWDSKMKSPNISMRRLLSRRQAKALSGSNAERMTPNYERCWD